MLTLFSCQKEDKKISSVVKFIVRLPIKFLIIINIIIAVFLIICFVFSVCVAGFLRAIMGEKNLTTKASIFSLMKKLNELLDDIKNEKEK